MTANSFGADELLLTAVALVDPVVQTFVHLEAGNAVEQLVTHVAMVLLLLSCVQPFVDLQAGHLREPLRANFALVRLFAGMDLQMSIQTGLLGKTLGTDVAKVGPFARVGTKMSLEVAQLVERLFASFALENLHSVLPLLNVRWRPVSVALNPMRRTTIAGQGVAVPFGYVDSFSLFKIHKIITNK